MILPGSYVFSLILLAVSLLLVGSWANTFKWTGGKWRFELYYFDFAVGAVLLTVIAALTLGSLGFDGFSFGDDLRLAGKRQDMFAFLAGGFFNLGNMLIVGGMSLTAMSVALPIGMTVGLAVGALADLAINRQASPLLVAGGVVVLILASVLMAMAWHKFAMARLLDLVRQGKTKSQRRTVSRKGITLCAVGGVFLGAAQPFIGFAREGDAGLGPYALAFVFSVGILLSTFVLNLFFMNLPVAGEPIDVIVYFRSKASEHLPGLLGGILLMGGVLASLAVARADSTAAVPPQLTLAITQGAIVLAMLWGLLAWKEMRGYEAGARSWAGVALLLVIGGIGLVSFALPAAAR